MKMLLLVHSLAAIALLETRWQVPGNETPSVVSLLAGLDCTKLGGDWAGFSCGGPVVYGSAGAAMAGATITVTTSMGTFTNTAAMDGSIHIGVDCAKDETVTVSDGTNTCQVKVRHRVRRQ